MRSTIWFGFALAAGLGLTLIPLPAGAPSEAARGAKDEKDGKKTDGYGPCDTKVCPLVFWGQVGPNTYAYYAMRCNPREPVCLTSSNPSLPLGNYCDADCSSCVDVGSYYRPVKGQIPDHHMHHFFAPGMEKGISRGDPLLDDAVLKSADASFVLAPFTVELGTTQDNVTRKKVRLYTVKVTPKETVGPPCIFGVGIEVNAAKVDQSVPYHNISRTWTQIATLHLGSIVYQVILDRSTTLDPRGETKKP